MQMSMVRQRQGLSRQYQIQILIDMISAVNLKGLSVGDICNCTEEIKCEEELLLMGIEEPTSFGQASKHHEWRQAMQEEHNSIKKDANGNLVKYKARLSVKVYVCEKGIDFNEIFAPVTRLEIVHVLLALAAKND